jgi:hypothetical protein
MTIQTMMTGVSIFTAMGALFLAFTLRRFHRQSPVAQRMAWLPVCTGLQAANVAVSFIWDPTMVSVPAGMLARSTGGWLFMGLSLWYLGFYFAGKINGK